MKQRSYEGWQITASKDPTRVKWRGSWEYWCKSIGRLNVFADADLRPGEVEDGKIDLDTRLAVYHVFKRFMAKYEGVPTPKNQGQSMRPFADTQEAEIRRILAGGLLVSGPQ